MYLFLVIAILVIWQIVIQCSNFILRVIYFDNYVWTTMEISHVDFLVLSWVLTSIFYMYRDNCSKEPE